MHNFLLLFSRSRPIALRSTLYFILTSSSTSHSLSKNLCTVSFMRFFCKFFFTCFFGAISRPVSVEFSVPCVRLKHFSRHSCAKKHKKGLRTSMRQSQQNHLLRRRNWKPYLGMTPAWWHSLRYWRVVILLAEECNEQNPDVWSCPILVDNKRGKFRYRHPH